MYEVVYNIATTTTNKSADADGWLRSAAADVRTAAARLVAGLRFPSPSELHTAAQTYEQQPQPQQQQQVFYSPSPQQLQALSQPYTQAPAPPSM